MEDPIQIHTSPSEESISVDEMIRIFEERFGETHIAEGNKLVAETLYPEYAGRATLAVLRLRAGLSQRCLADRLGVTQRYVARLEARSVTMTYQTMDRLAHWE